MRVGGATALWVGTKGNGPVVRRLGRWASDAVHSYLWDLPVLTEGMTTAMVNADTTVPWGSVRKEITSAPLHPVENKEASARAGSEEVVTTDTWNPICTVCPRCGRGCERHQNGADGTPCSHSTWPGCGCAEWGPICWMARETGRVQEERTKSGTSIRRPGGVGRTTEGWRAFFARGSVTVGGSSSSSENFEGKNCRVCRAGAGLNEKRAGQTICRVCFTPW